MADFLRDGTEIQRLIARLHGAQRARIGWTEEAVRREFEVLREEIERALRERLPSAGTHNGAGASVLSRFLEHAERISVRSWHRSAAAHAD